MQRSYAIGVALLSCVLAVSQTVAQPGTAKSEIARQVNVNPSTNPESTIKGIKIMESGFDPETKILRLVLMNDRAADITAYHYCFRIMSTDAKQTREQCNLIDALTPVLEMQAARRARPQLPEITLIGPSVNFVHPGEKRIIEEPIGYNDTIFNGSIYVDEVAWSDHIFEGAAQFIIAERTAEQNERNFVSKTIKDALLAGQEPMLLTAVIESLRQEQKLAQKDRCVPCSEKRTHVLMDAINHLEQPERHLGNTRKFTPNDQTEFLNQFLVRHDSFSQETGKHVSLRKADEQ